MCPKYYFSPKAIILGFLAEGDSLSFATTPSYGHPSSPEEGTTLDAFFMFLPEEEVISQK